MNLLNSTRRLRRGALMLCIVVAAGCGSLLPATAPPPKVYELGSAESSGVPVPAVRAPVSVDAPTLVVGTPRAAAGFDSVHMVYVRTSHQLEHFAHSEWIDTPARMLMPHIVDAISRGGAFRAVGSAASGMSGSLRLEIEVLGLQQEFLATPSRVRLMLRADLLDNATQAVVASRDFDQNAPAASEDAYGGVLAADRAVQQVMGQLVVFCADAAAGWHSPAGGKSPVNGRSQ